MQNNSMKNIRIEIKGLVQGVGFRPFVYRTAIKNSISGWVKNGQEGVLIKASGIQENTDHFISALKTDFPPAALIHHFTVQEIRSFYSNGFQIVLSDEQITKDEITQIGPDIAVCPDCLKDMKTQAHRLEYPFTNCTNCGPRFSIIRDLPYDRERTTMDIFEMCEACRTEYQDSSDRRFHAQPVACLNCGPKYKFISRDSESENLQEVLQLSSELIDDGKIVAIKGIGGFFIACDATNEATVKLLRKKKNREGKPFAVMFRNIETAENYCFLDDQEKKSLSSWQRPIVILRSKSNLPTSVSNGIETVGALLPYMPFHFLLFEHLKTRAIVFTSGNFYNEPILISNSKAEKELSQFCDAVVSYNREIYNRTDDSLLRNIHKKPRLIRRSRGFAPNPIYLDLDVNGILATGAELKNTFCLGKGNQAILSQHIGDLTDFETFSFYEQNIDQFKKMFRIQPDLIAADIHPDYLSSIYALNSGIPILRVQHHHAHLASCMAEHGLDEKVIGISFDGTGLGDDGNIWGSEFFVCDLLEYSRELHFEYIPMPGCDLATEEPWRMAASWLYKAFGDSFTKLNLPFLKNISEEKTEWLFKTIQNKINCPLTSGSGRLFDSVSALLGLCNFSTFEAEAPMRLENIAVGNETGSYPYKLSQVIEFSEMFTEIIKDLRLGVDKGIISAKFHNTIFETIAAGAKKLNNKTGLKKVVLGGGTFQNRYLLERTEQKLGEMGFEVYSNCSIPCNDGGISLGQLVIAAKRKKYN